MLESGGRRPRLSSVNLLAGGLGLGPADRDRLIASVQAEVSSAPFPAIADQVGTGADSSGPQHRVLSHGKAAENPPFLIVGYEELAAQFEAAHTLSSGMVNTFIAQTQLLRTLDRQLGAIVLRDQVQAHLTALEDLLTFATLPSMREHIAKALADAATLAAWQALDLGAVERAWRLYELGKRAAAESKDPAYLAYTMAARAPVLYAAGLPELAVELVQEALRSVARKASARLVAWLHASAAEALAHTGQRDACLRALDRASAVIPPGDHDQDLEMPSVRLNENHLTRWRGSMLAQLGDGDAVSELYEALPKTDPTLTRASASMHFYLAKAHLARRERDEALNHALQARKLANRIGSARNRARIDQLATRL